MSTTEALPDTMRAATARRYGPPEVVQIETLPRPEPGPSEVLVKVAAFGVTRGDTRIRGLDVPHGFGPMVRLGFGLTRPRHPVTGREFAGEVVALGKGVTGLRIGDAVFGLTKGMTMGAGAEYCVAPVERVLPRPDTLTELEAAAFPFGGLTAGDFLFDQAQLQPGERVLVNGATGAVGSAAVQIARHHGAHVTATASAANLEFARELGAQEAVDYARATPQGPFDVIFDIAGTLPYQRARPMLAPGGRLCLVSADIADMLGASLRPRRGAHRLCAGMVKEKPEALARLLAIHAAGGYRPRIGTTLPFAQIVAAHRLASSGHKRGNVVVAFDA